MWDSIVAGIGRDYNAIGLRPATEKVAWMTDRDLGLGLTLFAEADVAVAADSYGGVRSLGESVGKAKGRHDVERSRFSLTEF